MTNEYHRLKKEKIWFFEYMQLKFIYSVQWNPNRCIRYNFNKSKLITHVQKVINMPFSRVFS